MAGPGFDAARYVEDVIKPIQQGWWPKRNLFRVYQLLADASQADVAAALAALPRQWATPELRQYGRACERLHAYHPEATAVLSDRKRRADHRAEVDRNHRALVAVVGHRLHGAPGMTEAAIAALMRESAGRWSRPDVLAALAGNRAGERAPDQLPSTPVPKRWPTLRNNLADMPYDRLWDYLMCAPGLAGVHTTVTATEARRGSLRKSRDRAADTETTVLMLVRQWLKEPDGLAAVLRHELMSELATEALRGYGAVRDLASADPERCTAAGLANDADALAYGAWCAKTDGERWERDYADAIAEGRLIAALTVLDARPLPEPWISVRENLRATVDRLAAELARARKLTNGSPEEAAATYLDIGRELSDHPDIEAGLLRCRAVAPERVTARVDSDRVVVTWAPSRSTAGRIGYQVVRGATVLVEDTTALSITDSPPVGVPCVYTVSATREGVPGEPATSAEVTVLPEVRELTVSAERPPGKPMPVTDLRATLVGEMVELAWTPQGSGRLAIRVPHAGAVPPTGVVPAANAELAGRAVAVEDLHYRGGSPGGFEVDDTGRVVPVGRARVAVADLDGERVLIPVTISGEWAAIGQAITIDVPLRVVTGLHAERFGPQVRLRWQWPQWAHDARVVWRAGTPPTSPQDPEASIVDVSRFAYASLGVRIRADSPGATALKLG